MAHTFKQTPVQTVTKAGKKLSRDALYWKHLEFPVTKKEHGAVTHIEFSPLEPHNYAVTASVRVKAHSSQDHEIVKTFGRFQQVAYCGSYRSDGKLLVAGGDEGLIRVYDGISGSLLRIFRGHEQAAHVSHFLADKVHVMSGSDDKTVRIWDIASQSEVTKYTDSMDYIRCGATSSSSKDIVVAGSYDHKVRMYDTRTGDGCMMTVDHGHPVESLLIFPTGGVIVSAGGNLVKVWDVLSGGRLLATCASHHKTITTLAFCSQNQRILSGSIDHHVKIYDVGTYQTVHSLDYPSAILSMAVSPDDSLIAVGMSDGLLSVQRRRDEADIELEKTKGKPKKASYLYKLQANSHSIQSDVVSHPKKVKLEKYDKFLKSFEHSKALDAAMDIRVRTSKPQVTVSVMQELIRRNMLRPALAARDTKSLIALLRFLQKNVSNQKLMHTVVDVSNVVLDLYKDEFGQNTAVADALLQLKSAVQTEVSYMQNCMELMGMLESLFASADTKPQSDAHRSIYHQGALTGTSEHVEERDVLHNTDGEASMVTG